MILIVRPPQPDDADQIVRLGEFFQKNSLFSCASWSDQKAHAYVTAGQDPNSNVFMRVAVDGDRVVGLFLGYLSEYFFSYEKIASDLVVFIYPEYRVSAYRTLKKMVSEFEAWAASRGAIETCIATSSGTDGAGYKKFLTRQGYSEVGFVTKKRI